ncbi:MAG: hypothetical protein AAF922_09045 [Pseudomonadota bacterium]
MPYRYLLVFLLFACAVQANAQSSRGVSVDVELDAVPDGVDEVRVLAEIQVGLNIHPESSTEPRELPISEVIKRNFINPTRLNVPRFQAEDISWEAIASVAFGCARDTSSSTVLFFPMTPFNLSGNETSVRLKATSSVNEFYRESFSSYGEGPLRPTDAMTRIRALDLLVRAIFSFQIREAANGSDGNQIQQSSDTCRTAEAEVIDAAIEEYVDDYRVFLFNNTNFLSEGDSLVVGELMDLLQTLDELVENSSFTELHVQFLNNVLSQVENRRIRSIRLHQLAVERLVSIYANDFSSAHHFGNETLSALTELSYAEDCVSLATIILRGYSQSDASITGSDRRLGSFEENFFQSMIETTHCASLMPDLVTPAPASNFLPTQAAEALESFSGGRELISAFASAYDHGEALRLSDFTGRRAADSGLEFYNTSFEARLN